MWNYIVIICHIFCTVKARLPGLLNSFFEVGKVEGEKREKGGKRRKSGKGSTFNVQACLLQAGFEVQFTEMGHWSNIINEVIASNEVTHWSMINS